MKELVITPREEGQRLDRMLGKYLPEASMSFLYRMLRKKNITLNGKKAAGSEKLKTGDMVRIWFSDDTMEKFKGSVISAEREKPGRQRGNFSPGIVYEDEHILFINKPAGMLTQKAASGDYSLNDWLLEYLLRQEESDPEAIRMFRPSVCNRLDRNTSGLVSAGKTAFGSRLLTKLFRDRTIHKKYECIVVGEAAVEQTLNGYLEKDHDRNQVTLKAEVDEDGKQVCTHYIPVRTFKAENGTILTHLEVDLITGRTHQIRAQLAWAGYPILGDAKYGNQPVNEWFRKHKGVRYQLLHCFRVEMPSAKECAELPAELERRVFTAKRPDLFEQILQPVKPD